MQRSISKRTYPMKTKAYWLSFADPDLPKGSQFLGVCIVEVDSAHNSVKATADAVAKAREVGANPGGEVQGFILEQYPHSSWMNRLLSRAEIAKADIPGNSKWHLPYEKVVGNAPKQN